MNIVSRLRAFYRLLEVGSLQKSQKPDRFILSSLLRVNKAQPTLLRCGLTASRYPLILFAGLFSYKKMADAGAQETGSKISDEFLKKSDDLFEEQQFEEVLKLLESSENQKDVEIIWRLVRVKYNLATHSKTLSDKEKKEMILAAYYLVYNALPQHENHYAIHKWLAVVLNEKAAFEGNKARIQQLETIKHHMNRAIELKPDDSTTLYMLGMWCFEITDMPWYQRKIANAIFDTLPTTSYDEALKYFLEAEKQHPLFYSQNVLMLGKTYLRLENYEQAAYYLEMTTNYPVKQDKDQLAVQEATKLLEKAKSYLKK